MVEETDVTLSTKAVREAKEQEEKKEVNLQGGNVCKPKSFRGQMIIGVKQQGFFYQNTIDRMGKWARNNECEERPW